MTEDTTSISCLTPPGRTALATLGLRGPRGWETIRALFRPRSGKPLPSDPPEGQFWLGRLGESGGDEVVMASRGAQQFEIHCHGGPEVVRLLLDLFERHALQRISWEDFLTGADSNGSAMAALSRASTVRTAAILLDQVHGALGRAFAEIDQTLKAGEKDRARDLLQELIDRIPLGLHLTDPWRVVVAGAPNVGKSSLVNAIAGYQRCVVSAVPGTTRDVVTTRLAIDGWPVALIDTAGLRGDADSLEGQGIELARREVAEADLCLWVLDASTAPVWPDVKASRMLRVVNKIDLPPAWELEEGAIRVCATTGEAIGGLCAAVSRELVPSPPPAGAAVPYDDTGRKHIRRQYEPLFSREPPASAAAPRSPEARG